ncbi:MAG TPA: SpoIVB peptidase S55 [Terracidiphilus sp.]
MGKPSKETKLRLAALVVFPCVALCPALLRGQVASQAAAAQASASPPPSTGGFFPLNDLKRGMTATAWTVFSGTKPEPMAVEILGVLRGVRGPGHDMILAQLHGTKPEYTGVVAGMSGSPVYIGNKLLGAISYHIGQFSKDAIAGITPIEDMLEVRDLPIGAPLEQARSTPGSTAPANSLSGSIPALSSPGLSTADTTFQPMETPLVMSGFAPQAVRLWQQKMAGTGLDMVAAGGMGSGSSKPGDEPSMASPADVVPGSAVSLQLIRGDLEIAATCTVTYIDPKQLLACGHPVLQAGPISLPMTKTEVVTTLASSLQSFKVVNTGDTIGSFTEDRESAIRGVFGSRAHMIPLHVTVKNAQKTRTLNVEILDQAPLTPQAVLVVLFQALLQNNESTAETSYHLTGNIDMAGYPPAPLDLWAPASDNMPAPMTAALETGERFAKLYSNSARQGIIRSIELQIEAIPRRIGVELESARLISGNIVHPGDTITVEATVRPWQQTARNVRIPVTLPRRLQAGTVRVLVSDAAVLDRTLDQPRMMPRPVDVESILSQVRSQHHADRIYVSLLMPETQAGMDGKTLSSLPISMANALESLRAAQDVTLNGESAVIAGEAQAGGVLNGFQVLNLRVEVGGGVN